MHRAANIFHDSMQQIVVIRYGCGYSFKSSQWPRQNEDMHLNSTPSRMPYSRRPDMRCPFQNF